MPVVTDGMLRRNGSVKGEVIDLENELTALPPAEIEMVRVERIRDMVEQLQRINQSVNRNEAVFVLRSLVARLSLFSFKQYLSAKNIQSEVHNVIHELTRFVNMMMSGRRPFLVRMLIRNITSIISKPMLIDRRVRDDWAAMGGPSLYEKAWEQARELLANHVPPALPDDVSSELRRIVNATESELGVPLSKE